MPSDGKKYTAASKGAILKEVELSDRQGEALKLRRIGMSYEDIGIEMGISHQAAGKLVRNALSNVVKEDAEDVLKIELERLDLLYAAALPYAIGQPAQVIYGETGHPVGVIPRIDPDPAFMLRCLEIQTRRAKYMGLDAPVRQALIEEEAKKLSAATGIPVEKIIQKATQLQLVG